MAASKVSMKREQSRNYTSMIGDDSGAPEVEGPGDAPRTSATDEFNRATDQVWLLAEKDEVGRGSRCDGSRWPTSLRCTCEDYR
jgi:hypothetical protein